MASSDGDQGDSGESEEEIKEIPLKKLAAKSMNQAKRARKGILAADVDDSSEDDQDASQDDRYAPPTKAH